MSPQRRGSADPARGPRTSALITTTAEWVVRLVALNLLWIVQVLAGGIALGAAPATVVLYHGIRGAMHNEHEAITWRSAWRLWAAQFVPAQQRLLPPILTLVPILGYAWMLAGTPFALSIVIVGAVYTCWLIHLPAVDALQRRRPLDLWRATLQCFAGTVPRFVATLVVSVGAAVAAAWYLPAALPAFFPSLPALLATLAVRRFARPAKS